MLEEEIFKDYAPICNKLLDYGFHKKNKEYVYETFINNEKFKVIINVSNTVMGKIIDLRAMEEYTAFRFDVTGTFASSIKEEYLSLLLDIRNACFQNNKKVDSWVIPANPKFFDVISYFDNNKTILWHQSIKVHLGDFIYIYLGSPFSAIMYKCEVIKTNFLGYGKNGMEDCMELKVLKKYDKDKYKLDLLRKYNLTSIRCSRKMPDKLSEYLYTK